MSLLIASINIFIEGCQNTTLHYYVLCSRIPVPDIIIQISIINSINQSMWKETDDCYADSGPLPSTRRSFLRRDFFSCELCVPALSVFFSSRLSVAPEVAIPTQTRVRFLPRVARWGALRRERERERAGVLFILGIRTI